jgi:hypothetical protein
MKRVVLVLSLFMSFPAFGMGGDHHWMDESGNTDDSEAGSELVEPEQGVELIPYGDGLYMTREQFEITADICEAISIALGLAMWIVFGVIAVMV